MMKKRMLASGWDDAIQGYVYRMTDALNARRGIGLRLLICDECRAVWPTERDDFDGGSRQDGEPCAYRWADGTICQGTVGPVGPRRSKDGWTYEVPSAFAYSGVWCAELGLRPGTTSLGEVRRAYRALSKVRHPDVEGGSHEAMLRLNHAYRLALSELGQPGGRR
jgi:hypothetical protein